jgi:pilus assembly protein Flp/PilA
MEATGQSGLVVRHLEQGVPPMKNIFSRFVKDESGATAIEYALIAAIIGVGIIVGLQSLKTQINATFTDVETGLTKR